MRTNLKKIAAVVGAVFATAGVAPGAHAATGEGLVQSVISIQNFVLNNNATGNPLNVAPGGDFVTSIITDGAAVNAQLNGVNGANNTSVNSQPPSPPLDLKQSCVGTGCVFAQNDFTQHSLPVVAGPNGYYARADMQLQGVIVAGIPKVPGPGNEPVPGGSNLLSEVQLNGNGTGNASSRGGTNGTVVFTTGNAGIQVQIKFDANSWMLAYVNPALSGQAAQSLSFRLTNATTQAVVFEWAPNGQAGGITGGTEVLDPLNLNTTLSADVISNGPFCQPATGPLCPTPGAGFLSFEARTNPLAANTRYVLAFSQTTSADLTVLVPEPDSLALFGAMFIALGFGARVAAKRRAS